MEVTILGASASCPNAGEACSGYLIRTGGDALLLDCGPGVLGKLQKHISYHLVPTVVISHLHPDHFLDLIPLCYGLLLSPNRNPAFRPRLYLPPKGIAQLKKIIQPLDSTVAFFDKVFDFDEYEPGEDLVLGNLTMQFTYVNHYVPTYAVRISAEGKTLAYSADTGPCETLAPLARGADVFICEATLDVRNDAAEEEWGHLAAREAGEIASQAEVKQLVLTHLWQEHDPERLLKEARAAYDGPVELAVGGKVYRI